MLKRTLLMVLIAAVSTVAITITANAQIPHQMTMQGILTDNGGTPLANDSVLARLLIYDAEVGGSLWWMEVQTVFTNSDGLFSLVLGLVVPIPDSVFADSSRWLTMKVGTDPEMVPRQPLVSAPYSFVSGGRSSGGAFLPLVGGTMTGAITSIGNPPITMGKGNFGVFNSNTGEVAFVAGWNCSVSGDFSSIGGGLSNSVAGFYAYVGGGQSNAADSSFATVTGGAQNISAAKGAFVGGGLFNKARGPYSVVSGGGGSQPSDSNTATGEYASVAGGRRNHAAGIGSAIGGGLQNVASTYRSTVGGGIGNEATGQEATIAGGHSNVASGLRATVGGGQSNTADATSSLVGGGMNNQSTGQYASIGGGKDNIAGGFYATVTGGLANEATGFYSCAAGRRAKATHAGTFVWADSTDADFQSTAAQQFLVRASGGVGIGTPITTNTLDVEGTVAIGEDYSGNLAAPINGLIVEGWTGIGTGAPNSRLHVSGAFATAVITTFADLELTGDHSVVLVNSSAAPRTIRLPSASSLIGRRYTIKKVNANNLSVTVAAVGGQTIDGSTTRTIIPQWGFVTIVSDGNNWMIISN